MSDDLTLNVFTSLLEIPFFFSVAAVLPFFVFWFPDGLSSDLCCTFAMRRQCLCGLIWALTMIRVLVFDCRPKRHSPPGSKPRGVSQWRQKKEKGRRAPVYFYRPCVTPFISHHLKNLFFSSLVAPTVTCCPRITWRSTTRGGNRCSPR